MGVVQGVPEPGQQTGSPAPGGAQLLRPTRAKQSRASVLDSECYRINGPLSQDSLVQSSPRLCIASPLTPSYPYALNVCCASWHLMYTLIVCCKSGHLKTVLSIV